MSVNPNAAQLLSGKYQQYATLLAQRADIDSRIMIVATDISQITSAALINAPIGSQPPIAETPTPAPAKEAKTEAKVVKKAPEEAKPQVKPPETEVKEESRVPTMDEANALVQEIVAKKGAAVLQSEIGIQKYTPFTGLTDELKAEFFAKLQQVNNA